MKTRNFADVIRARLAADPELAAVVGAEFVEAAASAEEGKVMTDLLPLIDRLDALAAAATPQEGYAEMSGELRVYEEAPDDIGKVWYADDDLCATVEDNMGSIGLRQEQTSSRVLRFELLSRAEPEGVAGGVVR